MIKLKFSLLVLFVSLFTSLNAQDILKITYAHQSKSDSEFAKDKLFKKAWQEHLDRVYYYELLVTPSKSIFNKIEGINNSQKRGRIFFDFSFGNQTLYKDFNKNESFSVKEYDFVIKDSLINYNWEITREKSNILGYEVRKATYSDDKQKVTAWYAPKLTIKNGPDVYDGLPGLILKIEVERLNKEKTQYYFLAESIEIVKGKNSIKKPKGKIISPEEYKRIADEHSAKFKEMQSQGVETDD